MSFSEDGEHGGIDLANITEMHSDLDPRAERSSEHLAEPARKMGGTEESKENL